MNTYIEFIHKLRDFDPILIDAVESGYNTVFTEGTADLKYVFNAESIFNRIYSYQKYIRIYDQFICWGEGL